MYKATVLDENSKLCNILIFLHTLVRVVESHQQACYGGLAWATGSHHCCHTSCGHTEIHTWQYLTVLTCGVTKRHIVKVYLTLHLWGRRHKTTWKIQVHVNLLKSICIASGNLSSINFVNCIMCMYSGPEAAYYQINQIANKHVHSLFGLIVDIIRVLFHFESSVKHIFISFNTISRLLIK